MADPTYTTLTANDKTAAPSGTTLAASQSLADAEPEKTILVVAETGGSADLTFTVKAGDYPPAIAAGQGDLAVTITKSTTQYIGPFESGRFLQNDGSMSFTSSATTGTIAALKVPRNT